MKNESQGLGTLSEEPLKHIHKNVHLYREKMARKAKQQANVTDVLTRLWVISDPIYSKMLILQWTTYVRSCPHRQAAISGCAVTGRYVFFLKELIFKVLISHVPFLPV